MSDTTFFWQGGQQIQVRKDESAITLHAASPLEASVSAAEAGVELRSPEAAGPGLVRADTVGDRELSVDRLRAADQVVHHVYRDPRAPDAEYLITDTFFIKLKPDTPEHRILAYLASEHLVVERDMGERSYLVRVTTQTGRNPVRTANAAALRTDVEYAEPNLVRPLNRFAFIPTDELFVRQWHLHAPNPAKDLVAGAGIFAPEAWDITRGTRGVVVAVADDGFDLSHPDFQGEGKVVVRLNATPSGSAAIAWDANVSPRPGDYHGTPCLGVAVAEGNGSGVVGVAPGCALIAIRFPLETMTDAHFVTMFEKVSPLADVISCSWGYGPAHAPMSLTLKSAITRLARLGGRRGTGLVFCVAAGNNNCPVQDLQNTRTYRYLDRFRMVRSHTGPVDRWIAAHPDVITVSATTSRTTRAAYSSWGRQISVCAPSDNWDDLRETFPSGLGITTTDNEGAGQGSDFTPGSRFTSEFGGTSSATPTVAGVCALVIAANPSLPAAEIREIVQLTADKNLSLTTDTPVNEPGAFDGRGFSLWFGFGKVNAFRAVQAAASRIAVQHVISAIGAKPADIAEGPAVSAVDIEDDGTITDLRVEVDIAHPFTADLRIHLLTPFGTCAELQPGGGHGAADLVKTYSLQETASLRPLLSKSVRGTWSLHVTDTRRFNVGRLNGWRFAARVAPAQQLAARATAASTRSEWSTTA